MTMIEGGLDNLLNFFLAHYRTVCTSRGCTNLNEILTHTTPKCFDRFLTLNLRNVSGIPPTGQCYFSCDILVIIIVKVIIFQVFQLQF